MVEHVRNMNHLIRGQELGNSQSQIPVLTSLIAFPVSTDLHHQVTAEQAEVAHVVLTEQQERIEAWFEVRDMADSATIKLVLVTVDNPRVGVISHGCS